MDEKKVSQGKPVDPEGVCRFFERIPLSLIEEPEICTWCEFFDEGFCIREQS